MLQPLRELLLQEAVGGLQQLLVLPPLAVDVVQPVLGDQHSAQARLQMMHLLQSGGVVFCSRAFFSLGLKVELFVCMV